MGQRKKYTHRTVERKKNQEKESSKWKDTKKNQSMIVHKKLQYFFVGFSMSQGNNYYKKKEYRELGSYIKNTYNNLNASK